MNIQSEQSCIIRTECGSVVLMFAMKDEFSTELSFSVVLKLDGSSFGILLYFQSVYFLLFDTDITVAKNPTVAQLKQAVEAAFSHLPKHGIGKVSWYAQIFSLKGLFLSV